MLNSQFTKLIWIPFVLMIGATLWSYNRFSANPISYIEVTTFYVGNNGSPTAGDAKVYNYDQYYKLASSSSFTDTLINIFTSPNTVSQIYQKSNVPLPSNNPDQLARVIKSQKVAANSLAIIVTLRTNSKNDTQKLSINLPQVVKENLDNLKKSNVIPQEIVVSNSDPIFLENKNNILISVGAPILAALIFGLALVYVIIGARTSNKN